MNAPRDPLALRADAPIFDAYLRALDRPSTAFTIPGHKRRPDLIGALAEGDVPLHGGLDTVKLTGDVVGRAERKLAAAWGADWGRISVGGSTHGNQALALAVGGDGDRVIVSRTLHRSMLLGLVLAGLDPVWVQPEIDPASALPGGVPVATIADALDRHPDAKAVFVGDPSYVGGIGDLAGMAAVCHRHGVPLIVDAAWGAHHGFHPGLPRHALQQGADALVTSAHKTLPAWSQGAIVVARTELLDFARLERGFEATNTTSPAGAVMASVDAARAVLVHHGERLLGRLLDSVAAARARIAEVPGVEVLAGDWIDPSKLVVQLHATTAHGHAVERRLIELGFPVEMADRDTIIPMVTMADEPERVAAFVDVLCDSIRASAAAGDAAPRAVSPAAAWALAPEPVISPRAAFFAGHETVPADAAIGRVCAELVAPYPPGVPVLSPGERVTASALGSLREAIADGARVAFAADPGLGTLQVVSGPVAER